MPKVLAARYFSTGMKLILHFSVLERSEKIELRVAAFVGISVSLFGSVWFYNACVVLFPVTCVFVG